MESKSDKLCHEYAAKRLEPLKEVFAKAAVGDFSSDVQVPPEGDEFTDLYAGVKIMLQVIGEKTAELSSKAESSAELANAVLQNAPDIIFVVDKNLNITFINRVLPGYEPEKVIGTPALDYIEPKLRDSQAAVYKRVFETGTPEVLTTHGAGAEGKMAWYRISVAPLNHKGKAESLIVISADVTAIKESEEKLKGRTTQLEKFNDMMVGREIRMGELKKENERLKKELAKGE